MTELEKAIEMAVRKYSASAWEAGFYAGQRFGQAYERYDPNRDPEWDEPTPPSNPYKD